MKRRDRVYIIPTYYGFIYGGGIIVCLLAAAIYNNNLAYLLTFFLVALFVIGMHQANSNLKKLFVERARFELIPAGGVGTGLLYLKSENPDGHIKVFIKGRNDGDVLSAEVEHIHPKSMYATRCKVNGLKRGAKKFGKITLYSRYPFGLFYVWKTFVLDAEYFVYPQPLGNQPLPPLQLDGSTLTTQVRGKGEDFSGHKEYQIGESQRRIDWKAFARGRPLLVKEFEDGEFSKLVLSNQYLNGEREENLQQLAKWIFECERQQITYSLVTDDQQTAFGSGHRQKELALKLLAEARL